MIQPPEAWPRAESMTHKLIPPRFRAASFDTYRTTASPSQLAAYNAVQAWLKALEDGPMLALVGKQGAGKSHLLYSAARVLIEAVESIDPKHRKPYPCVAAWYSLSDQLRWGKVVETEAGTRSRDGASVRTDLWSRRVVLLDEVRATSGTAFDDTELAKFACHAYDNRIAVMITTNVNPLADVMGDAAASRFRQVIVSGPDARQVA